MNRTRKSVLFAVVLILVAAAPWTAEHASAQNRWNIDTTCLELYFHALYHGNDFYHDDSLYNPDSVMLDTCLSNLSDGPIWIHRGIHLEIPIWVPWAPADTIMELPWTAIDTNYPQWRFVFKNIYDSIGPFVVRRLFPDDTIDYACWFEFHFFSFTPADSVYKFLYNIPNISFQLATPVMPGGAGVREGTSDDSLECYFRNRHAYLWARNCSPREFKVYDELGRAINNIAPQSISSTCYDFDFSNATRGLYFIQSGTQCFRIFLDH